MHHKQNQIVIICIGVNLGGKLASIRYEEQHLSQKEMHVTVKGTERGKGMGGGLK